MGSECEALSGLKGFTLIQTAIPLHKTNSLSIHYWWCSALGGPPHFTCIHLRSRQALKESPAGPNQASRPKGPPRFKGVPNLLRRLGPENHGLGGTQYATGDPIGARPLIKQAEFHKCCFACIRFLGFSPRVSRQLTPNCMRGTKHFCATCLPKAGNFELTFPEFHRH